ncbi:MAG: VTT domain-containing protein, partial [Verrucomicrobiota bacterium]
MIAQMLFASAAIIVLSLVSEDAATISSALLIFGGPLNWPLGFASCFAGIWLGDLGLYSLARYAGRSILEAHWLKRLIDPARLARCEETFMRNSSLALIVSRFVPGTRLPTYLAAGFFAMPIGRFALITAIGALGWISAIFCLTKLFGAQALSSITFAKGKIAAAILIGLILLAALFAFRKIASSPAIRRWQHWEFWPAWLFYIPVGAYYMWLSLRYRSFTLPTAANPGLENGGFVGESKIEILRQLYRADADLVSDAYLIDGWTTSDRLLSLHRLLRAHKIGFPFILKPDLGQRGNGVRLIKSMREALDYLTETNSAIMVQRYASGEHEAGVFYFRFPGQSRGQIFSITEKLFPTIVGDGIQTIGELIRADPRASL